MLRSIGILALSVIVISSIVSRQFPRMLQLELADSAAAAGELLGATRGSGRQGAAKSTRLDFFFIAGYGLLFLAFVWLMWRSNLKLAMPLAVIALLGTLGAAAFDVVENFRILDLLGQEALTEEAVRQVRLAATAKWLSLFTTMAVLSPLFLARRDPFLAIGVTFLGAAVAGLLGLLPALRPLYERAMPVLLGLGLLTVAVLFLFRSRYW